MCLCTAFDGRKCTGTVGVKGQPQTTRERPRQPLPYGRKEGRRGKGRGEVGREGGREEGTSCPPQCTNKYVTTFIVLCCCCMCSTA